jgi:hypothetical protein
VPSPAQVRGDGPNAVALAEQVVHQSVVGAGAFGETSRRLRGCRGVQFALLAGARFGRGGRGQAAAVADDAAFDRLAEVLPQMESVGDLDCVGCARRAPSA